jgi:hypothetical protein
MLRKASQFRHTSKRKAVKDEPYFLDPWRHAVCDRCPLPDCVRPEGAIFAGNRPGGSWGKGIYACPIYQAQERCWGPAEAAARGGGVGAVGAGGVVGVVKVGSRE